MFPVRHSYSRLLRQSIVSVRCQFHTTSLRRSGSTNPQLSFPCLDRLDYRTEHLNNKRNQTGDSGLEFLPNKNKPEFDVTPFSLDYGGILPNFDVAYETWGQLNETKTNAILLHTGLSASSHAKSHAGNTSRGWWENFIGPGAPIDTKKYFVICTNVIGGCYGSTGPSSEDPADGLPYATRFPIISQWDMVRAQFCLLDSLGIEKLHASVGSSMGGMQSLAAGKLFPSRVGRIVTISGAAKSHPYSIALRHTQRQILMADPHWNRGFYYDSVPPHHGMKLARQLATITYRSGPEWEIRFGRKRADPTRPPALCPDFLIETYLDHSGEKWCLQYDPNSLLYISKAMDLFDMSESAQQEIKKLREQNGSRECDAMPLETYKEKEPIGVSKTVSEDECDLIQGFLPLKGHPVLVIGAVSDILFPARQQREIVDCLRAVGNENVTHVELSEEESLFGHDSFLLLEGPIGDPLKHFLG